MRIFHILCTLYLLLLKTPVLEASWNYATDCWSANKIVYEKSVGSGRFKVKIKVTLPPDPLVYSACLIAKTGDGALRNFFYKNGVYGNFCGVGWRDKSGRWQSDPPKHTRQPQDFQSPVDVLDTACRRHDFCYDDYGLLNYRCDGQMNLDSCSVAGSNLGKNRLSETSSLMCVTWSTVIIRLSASLMPFYVLGEVVGNLRGD